MYLIKYGMNVNFMCSFSNLLTKCWSINFGRYLPAQCESAAPRPDILLMVDKYISLYIHIFYSKMMLLIGKDY